MIISENLLRNIIKNSISKKMLQRLTEAPNPPKGGYTLKPDRFEVGGEVSNERSASKTVGASTKLGVEQGGMQQLEISPTGGQLIKMDPVLGAFLKVQITSRHQAITQIFSKQAKVLGITPETKVNFIKLNSLRVSIRDLLEVNNSDKGTFDKLKALSDQIFSGKITGSLTEGYLAPEYIMTYFIQQDSNFKGTVCGSNGKLNPVGKAVYEGLNSFGFLSAGSFELLFNLIDERFCIPIWKKIFADIATLTNKKLIEPEESSILAYFCLFAEMPFSISDMQTNIETLNQESATQYASIFDKITAIKNSGVIKSFLRDISVSAVDDYKDTAINVTNLQLKALFRSMVLYADLINMAQGSGQKGALELSIVFEFINKLIKGIYNFLIICKDVAQEIEQNKKDSLLYLQSIDSERSADISSLAIKHIFTKLDLFIIEGVQKYISQEFYKVDIEEKQKVELKNKIKIKRKLTAKISGKIKQKSSGQSIGMQKTCSVPAACCGPTVIQFNLNMGGNQNNTQKVGGI